MFITALFFFLSLNPNNINYKDLITIFNKNSSFKENYSHFNFSQNNKPEQIHFIKSVNSKVSSSYGKDSDKSMFFIGVKDDEHYIELADEICLKINKKHAGKGYGCGVKIYDDYDTLLELVFIGDVQFIIGDNFSIYEDAMKWSKDNILKKIKIESVRSLISLYPNYMLYFVNRNKDNENMNFFDLFNDYAIIGVSGGDIVNFDTIKNVSDKHSRMNNDNLNLLIRSLGNTNNAFSLLEKKEIDVLSVSVKSLHNIKEKFDFEKFDLVSVDEDNLYMYYNDVCSMHFIEYDVKDVHYTVPIFINPTVVLASKYISKDLAELMTDVSLKIIKTKYSPDSNTVIDLFYDNLRFTCSSFLFYNNYL